MIDFLLQIGISNALVAPVLALIALTAGILVRRPQLTYMLWLLVFIKLVTPPIFNFPLPAFSIPIEPIVNADVPVHAGDETGHAFFDSESTVVKSGSTMFLWTKVLAGWQVVSLWFACVWVCGSAIVLAWTIIRVLQFHCLLEAHTKRASSEIDQVAQRLAKRLNLKSLPKIETTSAQLAPMVWWIGGRVRIVIPESLLDSTRSSEWQWVLAHELAHVQRRDYLVRWIEWFACVCFWWNPVMWWAQGNLRATEEICCDALVLSRFNPAPVAYANSILNAVESLVRPAIRPPAMASEINSGGFLERRFKMIISGNAIPSNSMWMQTCVFLLAVVVIPLGLVQAQDFDKVSKRLNKAVNQGHLTQVQADAMMATLHRMGNSDFRPASDARLPFGVSDDADQKIDALKDVYSRAATELEKAVANGRITNEEMTLRLDGLRATIAERLKQGEGPLRKVSKEDFQRAAAEMEKMVAEGKVKREDMEKRLGAMRRMMGDSGNNASGETSGAGDEAKMDRHRAIAEKINAALEAGELSPEGARKKLQALREEISNQKPIDLSLPAKVADNGYDALAKRLKKAVESGDLTEKEARLKLKEFGDKLKSKPDDKVDVNKRKEAADKSKAELEAIVKKIRQAVADGLLTKKEAEAKLKAIKEKAAKDQSR